nr:hypothetical protein [Roseateles aquatilis]
MNPTPQQVGVDAVSFRDNGQGKARLLLGLHGLSLEIGAVNSPSAAYCCFVHSAYASI